MILCRRRVGSKAAAVGLKFSTPDLNTEAEKALAVGVHERVLKGNGRMIVGSIAPEVYLRIEEYARKASGADARPKAAGAHAVATKVVVTIPRQSRGPS